MPNPRCSSAVLLLLGSIAIPAQQAVLQRNCFGCHNSKAHIGGLALDKLDPQNVSPNPEAWEKVVRKMRARTMPPVGMPRPDEAAYQSVVSTLEKSLDALKPDPGRTETFRRLNRTEYKNAIRDLLTLDVD